MPVATVDCLPDASRINAATLRLTLSLSTAGKHCSRLANNVKYIDYTAAASQGMLKQLHQSAVAFTRPTSVHTP